MKEQIKKFLNGDTKAKDDLILGMKNELEKVKEYFKDMSVFQDKFVDVILNKNAMTLTNIDKIIKTESLRIRGVKKATKKNVLPRTAGETL